MRRTEANSSKAKSHDDGQRRGRWQKLVHDAQSAAVMTLRLAELDGVEPIDEEHQLGPDPARIQAVAADFIEVARIKTLDDVGEGYAAVARLRGWLAASA